MGTLQPAALAGASFILYPTRSNMRTMIDGFLRELGMTPRVIMEADDTEAIKKLVETGFGYSVLPEYALRGRSRFFQVFRVEGRKLVRTQALAMARTERRRAAHRNHRPLSGIRHGAQITWGRPSHFAF